MKSSHICGEISIVNEYGDLNRNKYQRNKIYKKAAYISMLKPVAKLIIIIDTVWLL